MNQDKQIELIIKKSESEPAPVYLLMGEEPFFIDQLSSYFENNLLPEDARAFNQTILYGPSTSAGEITDTATRFPMGADR